MWWRSKPERRWPIDPEAVAFGSVVDGRENLSRTHVLVQFSRGEPRYIEVAELARTTAPRLAENRPLRIRRLVVAPLTKRRHARFFDRLTDWGPATKRALGSSRGPRPRLTAATSP